MSKHVTSFSMFALALQAAWDPERRRLLYMGGDYAMPAGELREIDVDDRTERVVASSAVGTGPALGDIRRVALDESGTRAFVGELFTSEPHILAVDLASGNRTAHPVGDHDGRVDRFSWKPFVVDARRNRLLAAEYPTRAISAVDLTSGAVSVVGDAKRAGPGELHPYALHPDLENDRLLIGDLEGVIQMMDVTTGERVVLIRTK